MEGDRWLERGARVGDYTIEDLLGEGGFGAVFRARSDAGVLAALKVFKTTAAELTAERLISQQNEIEALLKLDHPSLIQLYGYGFVEGVGFYLAMEIAVGETLDAYLERVGALDALDAVRLMRKVAEALAHCHARDVLHLDLKPSNIVIVDPHEPRVKVLDFGLATLTSGWQPDDTRVTAGTVGYMAPECLRSGRARPDPRMDLYALGTILYELVSGKLPFEGRGQRTIMMNRTVGEMVPLRDVAPSVPPAIAALIDELLAQDPSQRPGSAAQLCARLKEVYYDTLRGEEPEGERGPQSTRVPQSGRMTSLPPRHNTEEAPFVGRERELSLLASRVLGTTSRAATPVVIVGDAGIGKSRLVSELLNVVEQDGAAVVIYARCRELSALVPYSPLREALSRVATATRRKSMTGALVQAAIDATNDEDAELLTALVPELGRGLGDADARRTLLRPSSAKRVAELVRRLVTRIAADLPVLVAIEDMHWGDEATLAVLELLSGTLGAAKVFLLGTTRPPLRVAWRGAALMDLGPLDREENGRLLAELARGGDESILRELEQHVPLLAAGNPLFGIQVIRNLEVEGFVGRTTFGTLSLGSRNLADYRAPASITEALRRGVDSLSPESREVLGVAALLGRNFLRSDLRALGLFSIERIDRALDEGEKRCLLLDAPTSTTFVHDVVLEQLERRAVRADLREHHLRIARQLERRGADPGTLARHLERAGETLRAADAYLTAALARPGNDPGAGPKLHRAIDLVATLPASPEQRRIQLVATAELVRMRWLLAGTEELLKLVERCTADTTAASAMLGAALARVHEARGELTEARRHAEQSIAAAGKEPSLERHRSAATNILGRVDLARGFVEEAARSLAAGSSLAEREGDLVELCHARSLYGVALGWTGDLDGAEREIQAAAHLAEQLADPARLLGAWHACALLAEARYDWDLGVSSTAQLLAYAEEHKLGGHYLYMGTLYAGRHQFHVGHLHRARMLVTNALNLARIVGTGLGRALGQVFLGDVHLVEGHLADALLSYERAIEQGAGPNGDEQAVCLGLLGRMHITALRRGDPREVRRLGEEATSRMIVAGQRAPLLGALERFAESLAEVRLGEDAANVRARHEALAQSLGTANGGFWPRIPDLDARAAGMRPRDYWRSKQARSRTSGEWSLPAQQVSPSRLLTTRGGQNPTAASVSSTAQVMPSRTVRAPQSVGLQNTVPRTGLLEALATVEGFVPALLEEEAGM
ncbi:serine/threonine-protein kinase [Polyangium sp. 15x6]|uniref:serine/threonine-protein kinase n=1 Tax=Polyangium sp. 15x6 TaxID=3042687 RepID=UPI00249AF596|nr:serine/threonine-protein kinase [Polyangium sp. 15x6]MDI3283684.1 protein kinase [Polyangium sp. 15x6]